MTAAPPPPAAARSTAAQRPEEAAPTTSGTPRPGRVRRLVARIAAAVSVAHSARVPF